MEDNIFTLKYEGAGISEGLEPALFAEAVRGFAEFISAVTENQYGSAERGTLKVHRLSQGSLILEILQHFGDVTINDMLAVNATVGAEVKAAISLLKHLAGRPPKNLVPTSDNRVQVENNHGNVVVFNNSTVNLVVNGDIGEAAERFAKPLANGQATGLSLGVNAEAVASVKKQEVGSMVSVADTRDLLESETELWLTATKVVLEGAENWTFSDGRRPFNAPVSDLDFLKNVSAGNERFGNGDRLLVRMRSKQTQRGSQLRTQYEITKVLRHERPPAERQGSLF